MSTHTVCVGPDGHFWESHGEPIWTRIPRLPGETDIEGMARILGKPENHLELVYFSIPMYGVKDEDVGAVSWDTVILHRSPPDALPD